MADSTNLLAANLPILWQCYLSNQATDFISVVINSLTLLYFQSNIFMDFGWRVCWVQTCSLRCYVLWSIWNIQDKFYNIVEYLISFHWFCYRDTGTQSQWQLNNVLNTDPWFYVVSTNILWTRRHIGSSDCLSHKLSSWDGPNLWISFAFVAFSLILILNETAVSKRICRFELFELKLKENWEYGSIINGKSEHMFHLHYMSVVHISPLENICAVSYTIKIIHRIHVTEEDY